jgi:hypothetical protein
LRQNLLQNIPEKIFEGLSALEVVYAIEYFIDMLIFLSVG